MAANRDIAYVKKRNMKEARSIIVAELFRKGKNYRDIQKEVMVRLDLKSYSLKTVHDDIKSLLAEWRELRITEMELLVQAELEKIAACEAELWAAWEKSKTDYKLSTQKQKGEFIGPSGGKKAKSIGFKAGNTEPIDDDEKPGIRTTRMEKTEINNIMFGDPRYMAALSDCREQRIKLLGLYAPTKVAQTDTEGKDVNFISFLMQVNTIDNK